MEICVALSTSCLTPAWKRQEIWLLYLFLLLLFNPQSLRSMSNHSYSSPERFCHCASMLWHCGQQIGHPENTNLRFMVFMI